MPELSYEIYNKNKINFPILFCCDHANNKIPKKFKNLDLKAAILKSHIGYDIGARSLAINLANHISAHHKMIIKGGILEEKASLQLKNWFKQRRQLSA